MTIESDLVNRLADKWQSEGLLVAKELYIPIVNQIY